MEKEKGNGIVIASLSVSILNPTHLLEQFFVALFS